MFARCSGRAGARLPCPSCSLAGSPGRLAQGRPAPPAGSLACPALDRPAAPPVRPQPGPAGPPLCKAISDQLWRSVVQHGILDQPLICPPPLPSSKTIYNFLTVTCLGLPGAHLSQSAATARIRCGGRALGGADNRSFDAPKQRVMQTD